VFGRPIFGGESDAPEGGARVRKFEADFSFAVADRAEKNDEAFLFFSRAFVREEQHAAAGDAGGHEDQGAVGVDGESFGGFGERLALRVTAADFHGDLHEDALAAASGAGGCGSVWGLGHYESL